MKTSKIRRIALGACVAGFALVVYVVAGPAQSLTADRDETCETCPKKRGMSVTGNPDIDQNYANTWTTWRSERLSWMAFMAANATSEYPPPPRRSLHARITAPAEVAGRGS